MDKPDQINSFPSVPVYCDDTTCQWCHQGSPQGKKLKRCRGCNIAIYCGKECQMAAWPTHKRLCRNRNPQTGEATDFVGYATPLALTRAVQAWSDIHKYSLAVLAHATIRSTGGVKASLQFGRMVIFVLSSRRANNAGADDNLAEAFSIIGVSNRDEEGVKPFREISEKIKRGVEGEFCGDSSNATPAGCVPVLYVVGGMGTPTVTSRYAVFLPSHHSDDAVLDENTVAFFHDICRIFMHFINHGAVIKPPTDGGNGIPPSGVMVRAGKGWTWQEDPGERAWEEIDRLMPKQIIPFQTTGSATDLWTRFKQW